MAKNSIEYIAKINKYICIKKLEINSQKTEEDIINFFISIQSSTNQKIMEYITKCCDIKKLDKKTNKYLKLSVDQFFKEIYYSKFNKEINGFIPKNSDSKYYEQFFRVYIIEKYAQKNKMVLSPQHISTIDWEDENK